MSDGIVMMGHFKVLRAHNQWRVGHEFHAQMTDRLMRLTEMGLLECLGGRVGVDPVAPEVTKGKGGRRGVKVRDGQVGDDGLRPQDD